jgi:hypothetical protein
MQLAIGWAQADQELRGMQLSAGANLVRGTFRGMQLTAGLNILRGEGRGMQLVAGANFVDGGFNGMQLAGGGNVVTGKMDGVQMAGGVNVASEARGWQLAGGVNVAKDFTGWQLAPINYAETMTGHQLGVVNVNRFSATGFRLGVVNVAGDSHGFSFGVVNVAKHEDGESFALINIVGNGIHDVSLFTTDVMLTNIGFKIGGRHLYTNLIAGYQPGDALAPGLEHFTADTKRFATGAGIGWRQPIEYGRLAFGEIEADWLEVRPVWDWTQNAPQVSSLRLQAGVRLAPYITLLAGAGVNVSVATDGKDVDLGRGTPQSVFHSGATTVRIYPGLLLGLQI